MSQLNILPLDISQPADFKGDKSVGGAFFGSTTDNGCCDKKPESSFAQVIERHLEEKNSRSDISDKNTEQKQATSIDAKEGNAVKNDIKAEEQAAQRSEMANNADNNQESKTDVQKNASHSTSSEEQDNSIELVNKLESDRTTQLDEQSNAFMKMLYAAGEMLLGKKADAAEMENTINEEFLSNENKAVKGNSLKNPKGAQFEVSEEMAAQFKNKLVNNEKSLQPVQPITPIVSETDDFDSDQLNKLLEQATNTAKIAAISAEALVAANKQTSNSDALQQELKNIQQSLQQVLSQVGQTDADQEVNGNLLKSLKSDVALVTEKIKNSLTDEQSKKLLADLASLQKNISAEENSNIDRNKYFDTEIGVEKKNIESKEANVVFSALKGMNEAKNNSTLTMDKNTSAIANAVTQSLGQQSSQQTINHEVEENTGSESVSEGNDYLNEHFSSKAFGDTIKNELSNQSSTNTAGLNHSVGVLQTNVESQLSQAQARADANAADLAIDNLAMKQSSDTSPLQKSQQMQLNEVVNVFRKDFADSLKDKVMIMMSNRLQQIDIQLDPPELGNMHVRVNLQNEQAAVSFVVQNQQAKEAVEQQLTRLREMLADRGIDVGDANVRQENPNKNQQMADEQNKENNSSLTASEDGDFVQHELSMQQLVNASSNGVDFYA